MNNNNLHQEEIGVSDTLWELTRQWLNIFFQFVTPFISKYLSFVFHLKTYDVWIAIKIMFAIKKTIDNTRILKTKFKLSYLIWG